MLKIVAKTALSLIGLTALGTNAPALAQSLSRTVTIDENGNGTVTGGSSMVTLASGMRPDPGPGGLFSVLTYTLPAGFSVVPGDVHLTDDVAGGAFRDVIRFNQVLGTAALPGTIAFYSDNYGGIDALADTTAPPAWPYSNLVSLAESGPEGDNGAFYTPTASQPGYVNGFTVTYHFISDSPVPEPATWALMLAGFAWIGFAMRQQARSQPERG